MHNIIEARTRRISIKPKIGFLNPKNRKLHNILSKRFDMKTYNIILFSFLFFEEIHAKYIDNAIRKNNIVHTTGKTIFGGVMLGLIESYQSLLTLFEVNMLPIPDAENAIIKDMTKTIILYFIVLFLFLFVSSFFMIFIMI